MVERRERKRLTSVSYGANVVGLESEDCVSSGTTPYIFIIKIADNKLEMPFFSFSFHNDEKQRWSCEGECCDIRAELSFLCAGQE